MAQYIDPQDLASLIRDPTLTCGKDYAIVDVRDTDFAGGNIPGAINVPAHRLYETLPSLLSSFAKVPLVVFHCALSQVRGPKSARIYRDARAVMEADEESTIVQEVRVLRNGFSGWQSLFHEDTHLVENYDRAVWMEG
ncbi:MAG: Rhodanese-like domain-containing protein [Piptocephalis tieghemiana]|nr:MAG: Rhodanese-like domain-containing protein [Piptocephalis tieghemiana]